ncbi:transcriptional regulator [Clostridium estertheticum]|uniref:transcriptional regulator n=1 Tax=Clostridium estertheticum TaxID=238834 RepID=UPI001CF44755|nr:transcriptional regulator [Clostridium estertheticum]MCB2359238.1 transcriptional regulator [Clostridium estertheticum]
MEVVQQTNRTMLFEEINPQKLDIITVIGDTKGLNSLNDDKIKEINECFLVKSFDEFLDKFSPVIYSFYNASNQKVMYTLKKPENLSKEYITEIPINQSNDFLKMLFTLIDAKSAQGVANVDFKFENLLDMISPKKVMDDIKQSRKEIQYIYSKYEGLEEGDPSKLDLADKLNYMFEEASCNYNNIMAMLPLAIEDIKTRLLLGEEDNKADNSKFIIGALSMGENGELKVLEAPKNEETALVTLDDNANIGLIKAFEDDYDVVNDTKTGYVKDLVIRTFCPLVSTMESRVNLELEVTNYNTYLEFYKNAKDDFVKTVKPLVEKLVGVKMFFNQYKTKNKGMQPTLLVSNTTVNRLVNSKNISRLITYLNTVNDKNDFTNTIWFGIAPSIELESHSKSKVKRQRFKGNEQVEKSDTTSMEDLALLLSTIRNYRIQTFFSFQTGEDTTFNHVATEGIDRFMDKCAPLMRNDFSEFAVPCVPNFTIIPKDKSGVIIDKKMLITDGGTAQLSKEKEDILKLWIEGVYIGSSYIAAGIVASYQCPEFLRESYKNVSYEYPGIRFDIEAADNSLRVTTTLAKEISGFTNEIKNSINRKNFGFIFSSENAQVNGKDVKHITVYKARSLLANGNDFESIYKTTVTTYIERMLRFHTNDFKEDNIVKFFSNNPSSIKSKWVTNKGYINSIIQEGDDISFLIDEKSGTCNINIVFNGNVKNLEVEITRNAIIE